jgi:hypothetical protein
MNNSDVERIDQIVGKCCNCQGSALTLALLKAIYVPFKEHDVRLAESLRPILAEHIRRYPPVLVTLAWKEPDG